MGATTTPPSAQTVVVLDGVEDGPDVAITLYNQRTSDAVTDNTDLFDFDDDGRVTLFDAIALSNELSD